MRFYSFNELIKDSKEVASFFKDKQIEAIVTLSRGGLSFTQLVSYKLDIRDIFTIRVVGYEKNKKLDNLTILDNINLDRFKNILLLDDIIDSGRSINSVAKMIKKDNNNLYICSLFYKPNDLIKPDFYLYKTNEWINFEWENYGD